MEMFSSSAESYSQVNHHDLVSDFKRLVIALANALDDKDTRKTILFFHKDKFSQGDSDMKALEILEKLEEKGVFSASNIKPLEDLLTAIPRCDLIQTHLEPYRQKYDSYLLSQTSGTGSLGSAASSSQLSLSLFDTSVSEVGPSQAKRAKLDEVEEFDVSKIHKECDNATVHGMIVRVSRLRKARNSSTKYFLAEVTDGIKTLKLVCYDPPLRDVILELKEKAVAVSVTGCDIKQSTYHTSKGKFELLCNQNTKVFENPQKKFDIQSDTVYTYSTVLDKLEDIGEVVKKQIVTVRGKIVSINNPSDVSRHADSGKFKMQECVLADSSMTVKLKIWEEDIGKVVKESSYQLINMKVKEFDGERFLSTNDGSEICRINDIAGPMSTKVLPSVHLEIIGEISGFDSVAKYRKCVKCGGSIKELNRTTGECNKCGCTVKLKLCVHCVRVNFTIQVEGTENLNVAAFDQVVDNIIDLSDFSCREASESEIKDGLLNANPATFVLDHKNIVVKVKRET